MAMSVPGRALQIGASDLKKWVGYKHCGSLHIKMEGFLRRHWKNRYVVITKGYLYVYEEMHSKKPEKTFSLYECERVGACENENGDDDGCCFHVYEKEKKPLLFCCDNAEIREIWLEKIHSAILEVNPNLSADSGYGGSASSNTGTTVGNQDVSEESYSYAANVTSPIQGCSVPSTNTEKIEQQVLQKPQHDVKPSKPKVSRRKTINQHTGQETEGPRYTGQPQGEVVGAQRSGICMHELKTAIKAKHVATEEALPSVQGQEDLYENNDDTDNSTDSGNTSPYATSILSTASSFVSVTEEGGGTNSEEFLVRQQENLYENNNDTDNSTEIGNTSPNIIYENLEPLAGEKYKRERSGEMATTGVYSKVKTQEKFEKENYFCDDKIRVKRVMNQTPDGTFAVFPGKSTEQGLCVMTKDGLKYFRIYSESGRVSLFNNSPEYVTFSSLGCLLAHYHFSDLPASDYSVKLQRGFKSV